MLKSLKYLKKYWYFALLAPFFMIFEVLMDAMLPSFMEKMIDYGIMSNNLSNIEKYGFIMLGIVLIGVLSGILSGVFANLASLKFANDLRKDLFKKIMNLSYDQTDKFQTGSLVTRVTNDITTVQNFISTIIRGFVRSFGLFLFGIIFTIKINVKFAIVLAVALPIEILVMIFSLKKTYPVFGKIQKKLDGINTVVHENLTGARVVKAFGKEEHENERFNKVNVDYSKTLMYVNKIFAIMVPLFTIIIYSATIAIYAIGGHSIFNAYENGVHPNIMVGEVSQAITYVTMICMSLLMVGMTFTNLASALASASRINEVLDCPLEIENGNMDTNTISQKGTIEFKNVSFKYPSASGYVLNNINLKINQGESIAIVGSTGCGKSSLVNLLPRFYDVTEGSLLIDGIDVKEYNLEDLRNKIAPVLQKAELFAGTIKENICWGKANATDEEIEEAATIAQAKSFIEAKPDKYDEYVEEKGTSLSGGQKQRISIARAIIKKPEILIFDDATSALDLLTEANLYKELNNKMKDCTKIIVTQRVATAKNASKIAILDNGTIVAFDTHDNLLKNCSIYQDIYNSQLKKDEKEG